MDFWDAEHRLCRRLAAATRSAATTAASTWQILPTPDGDDQLTDIELLGPDELWVSTAGGRVPLLGDGWTELGGHGRSGAAGFGSFSTIAATPAGDAWIAGWQGAIDHFSGPPPPPVNQPPAAVLRLPDHRALGRSHRHQQRCRRHDRRLGSGTSATAPTSTERHPTHVFATADTYIVRLTVTDDDGDTGVAVRFIVVQPGPGGTFGDFTEVTPLDPLFVTPQDEDFWVAAAAPADYDGDGDLDIAVLGYYVVYNASVEERLVLLRNDGPAERDGVGLLLRRGAARYR